MRSEKLLIWLKPKFLGDAVMATPVLHALAETYDKPHVLAAPHIADMLSNDSAGVEMIISKQPRGFKEVMAEAKRLRAKNFDLVVLVNRSFRSALTAWLARIPVRVGHNTEGRGLLLTKKIAWDLTKFEGDCYGDLCRALGVAGDFSRVSLTPTATEREQGKEALQGADVILQPGASFAEKTMPAKALGKVVDMLHEAGYKVAMIGGPEEHNFGEALKAQTSVPMVDLIGKTSIRDSMGVLANARVAIGASTGIMHIAAAVGCPTVTAFGPTNSKRWGHLYPPHQSIQVPSGLIEDLDPYQVFRAAETAIDEAERGHQPK